MKARHPSVNWNRVLDNIRDAREELVRIEGLIASAKASPSEKRAGLEVRLGHAYYHLNLAWNARHLTTTRYKAMTESEVRKACAWPKDLWIPVKDGAGAKEPE